MNLQLLLWQTLTYPSIDPKDFYIRKHPPFLLMVAVLTKEAPNHIYEVEFDMVRTCNLHCKMCNFWTNKPNPKRLTTKEVKDTIKNLHDWFQREFKIAFAGGEPFMRPDMIEIIKYASGLGIITSVATNGTLLTEDMVGKLVESGLNGIVISIDSLNPEVHDYMRGTSGAFKRAFRAFNMIVDKRKDEFANPFPNLASIISKLNHQDVPELLGWLKKTGKGNLIVQSISANFFTNTKDWFDEKLWPEFNEDKQAINASIDKLIEMKRTGYPLLNEVGQLEKMKTYFKNLNWRALVHD